MSFDSAQYKNNLLFSGVQWNLQLMLIFFKFCWEERKCFGEPLVPLWRAVSSLVQGYYLCMIGVKFLIVFTGKKVKLMMKKLFYARQYPIGASCLKVVEVMLKMRVDKEDQPMAIFGEFTDNFRQQTNYRERNCDWNEYFEWKFGLYHCWASEVLKVCAQWVPRFSLKTQRKALSVSSENFFPLWEGRQWLFG